MISGNDKLKVTIVGGGMITHDQLLPSIYHLKRLGIVDDITICALNSAPLKDLADSEAFKKAFPSFGFRACPDILESPKRMFPNKFKEIIGEMAPYNVVVAAVPDQFHYDVIKEAIAASQHILCVKPLVLKYSQSLEIEKLAHEKGLFIGIEYHKRFDRRALLVKGDYVSGRFGEFKVGEARMVEPWFYRNSNFQNWFVKENSDPFTYVGCHYVDQVYFMTGLKPVNVSVIGIEGKFPNGKIGYMWTSGRVIFENGGILNVVDGLGYPDDGAGSNDQGITLFCDDGKKGALIKHNDQNRGVTHSFVKDPGPGGTLYNFASPDYFKLVPWEGEGLKPVGYGYDSVEAIIKSAHFVNNETAQMSKQDALKRKREILRSIDKKGIIATPANSYINELVIEAGRMSILNKGRPVNIIYGSSPHVEFSR